MREGDKRSKMKREVCRCQGALRDSYKEGNRTGERRVGAKEHNLNNYHCDVKFTKHEKDAGVRFKSLTGTGYHRGDDAASAGSTGVPSDVLVESPRAVLRNIILNNNAAAAQESPNRYAPDLYSPLGMLADVGGNLCPNLDCSMPSKAFASTVELEDHMQICRGCPSTNPVRVRSRTTPSPKVRPIGISTAEYRSRTMFASEPLSIDAPTAGGRSGVTAVSEPLSMDAPPAGYRSQFSRANRAPGAPAVSRVVSAVIPRTACRGSTSVADCGSGDIAGIRAKAGYQSGGGGGRGVPWCSAHALEITCSGSGVQDPACDRDVHSRTLPDFQQEKSVLACRKKAVTRVPLSAKAVPKQTNCGRKNTTTITTPTYKAKSSAASEKMTWNRPISGIFKFTDGAGPVVKRFGKANTLLRRRPSSSSLRFWHRPGKPVITAAAATAATATAVAGTRGAATAVETTAGTREAEVDRLLMPPPAPRLPRRPTVAVAVGPSDVRQAGPLETVERAPPAPPAMSSFAEALAAATASRERFFTPAPSSRGSSCGAGARTLNGGSLVDNVKRFAVSGGRDCATGGGGVMEMEVRRSDDRDEVELSTHDRSKREEVAASLILARS